MENRSTPSVQRPSGLRALLPTIFSAISVAMTGWIAYQNTQLKPRIDEISDQVQRVRSHAEQTSGGVTRLQQMDEARRRELFRRLTENKNNQEEVRRAFREVFPEDKFWADQAPGQPGSGAQP